jgi:hypothetical protein
MFEKIWPPGVRRPLLAKLHFTENFIQQKGGGGAIIFLDVITSWLSSAVFLLQPLIRGCLTSTLSTMDFRTNFIKKEL